MTISDEVKTAIMKTYGINNPQPSELKESVEMADFNFNDIQIMKLTERFNSILHKNNSNSTVNVNEVQNCSTVDDCIKLVTTKAKHS
jgi:hypothetical protein